MKIRRELSRKSFIQALTALGTLLFVWIWYRLSEIQEKKDAQQEFRHTDNIPFGVSYYEKYYLFRNENSVHAFSTKCTHAGCRIGKGTSVMVQCGCHGSQFEALTGKALKGPAIRPLQELYCHFDSKAGQWIIKFCIVFHFSFFIFN